MKGNANKLFFALFFLMLFNSVIAYEIVGDSVIQEDSVSKLVVTPHTTGNPLGTDFKQKFELTNKTAFSQEVYVAYRFNSPITNLKVKAIVPKVREWVLSDGLTCNPPNEFQFQLNHPNGSARNPHWIKCTFTDVDGTVPDAIDGFEYTVFETFFNSVDADNNTVFVQRNVVTTPERKIDVTNNFSSAVRNRKQYYYLTSPVSFNAGETKKWELTYTPNRFDDSKKWEMVFYTGSSANCILNNSCSYSQVLDPWWNFDWSFKQQLTLDTSQLSNNVNNNHAILVHIDASNTDFWDNVNANGSDVRFLNSTEDFLFDYHFEDFDSTAMDANIWVDVNETFDSINDNNIFVYYGNASALDAQDVNGTYDSGYKAVYHLNSDSTDALSDFNATSIGTETYVDGLISQGASGNGSSGFDTFGTLIPADNNFSLYALINRNVTAPTGDPIIFGQWTSGQAGRFYLGLRVSADTNVLYTGISGGVTDVANTAVSTNTWHQVGVTRNNDNDTYTFYLDGASDGTAVNATSIYQDTNTGLMTRVAEQGDSFNGVFDEAKIFSYVLSSDEMKLLYLSDTDALVTFGAQEEVNLPPDVNVVAPDNTGTYIKGGSTFQIDFSLADAFDSAVDLLFDINYSTSNSQGTGTVILNDGNVAVTSDLSCDSNTITQTPASCSYQWSVPSDDQNYFILMTASDATGLDFDSGDNNFFVDSTSPTTTSDANSSTWQKFDADVTLTCTDAGGCSTTQYRLDADSSSSTSFGAWQTGTTFTISSDGNYAIDFNSSDLAGNLETTNRAYALIDKTSPSTVSDVNSGSWQNTDANVVLSCSDSNSGCNITQYRLDSDSSSGTSFGAWQTFDSNIFVNTDGNYAIDFNSSDVAGNLETTNTDYVLVDKTNPSVTIDSPSNGSTTITPSVTITYTGTDTNAGIQTYWVSNDNLTWINKGTTTSHEFSSLSSGDHTFYVIATDNADNNSSTQSVTVTVTQVGGNGSGQGTTPTPEPKQSPFLFSIINLQEDTNALVFEVPRHIKSNFTLSLQNTGQELIPGVQILFSENYFELIDGVDVNANNIAVGETRDFVLSFDASKVSEEVNEVSGTVFITGSGVNQNIPVTFKLKEDFFTLINGFLSTSFAGVTLNTILLILGSIGFAILQTRIKSVNIKLFYFGVLMLLLFNGLLFTGFLA